MGGHDVRGLAAPLHHGHRTFQLVYGYLSWEQPAPGSFTDPIHVVIPSHSVSHSWKMVDWPQDHGGTLPTHGTPVLCGYDERGAMWVVRVFGTFTPYSPTVDPD